MEGEFRRLDPGEMSLSDVSRTSALLLLLLFVMRRGVTGAGFEDSMGGLVDEAVVPVRRRVLRRGGRFSVSVIVSERDGRHEGEKGERGSLLTVRI